jgi:hypothetical protein
MSPYSRPFHYAPRDGTRMGPWLRFQDGCKQSRIFLSPVRLGSLTLLRKENYVSNVSNPTHCALHGHALPSTPPPCLPLGGLCLNLFPTYDCHQKSSVDKTCSAAWCLVMEEGIIHRRPHGGVWVCLVGNEVPFPNCMPADSRKRCALLNKGFFTGIQLQFRPLSTPSTSSPSKFFRKSSPALLSHAYPAVTPPCRYAPSGSPSPMFAVIGAPSLSTTTRSGARLPPIYRSTGSRLLWPVPNQRR